MGLRDLCNVTYAILTDEMKAGQREEFDERLDELYLEDFPPGLERERERARRMMRDQGMTDAGLHAAMGMRTA